MHPDKQNNRLHPNVLEVDDLRVDFHTEGGTVTAVDGMNLHVPRGRVLGLVGESGCGKSVTAYSVLRLILPPGRIAQGRIRVFPAHGDPVDITALPPKAPELFQVRGGMVSMVFQEPMTALSPVHTIGNQLCEAILLHQDVTPEEAEQLAIEMLTKVAIPGPAARLKQYPFEMSGGMRQRVVIAMALVCNPELVIADEPTTALDVTTQAQVMGLLKELQNRLGVSVLLITHDLGVIAQMADDVAVMYLGRVVEQAGVRAVMKSPRHPYTRGLIASLPSLAAEQTELSSIAGSVPSLHEIPAGCPFHPRCPHAEAGRCDVGLPPPLIEVDGGHRVACLRANEIEEVTP
jgi:oligopeptide/dipeptide ABC transporter ATP-binding protein